MAFMVPELTAFFYLNHIQAKAKRGMQQQDGLDSAPDRIGRWLFA
jgi:hypothetical protein